MQEVLEQAVKAAARKATEAKSADDALKYTQAALNAVHAIATLKNAK